MADLMQFLASRPVVQSGVRVDLGGDLTGAIFEVRGITFDEWEELQRLATRSADGRPDQARLNVLMVLKACQVPDFSDAEAIEAHGCRTPEQLLHKMLRPGEVLSLAKAIGDISGFDGSYTRLVTEAKNS